MSGETLGKQLVDASQDGDIKTVRRLLKKGVDVNYEDTDKTTALMMASSRGHLDCLRLLLDHNADVNVQDEEGWTALIFATFWNQVDCVKLLLEYGADISLPNSKGMRPKDIAWEREFSEILNMITEVCVSSIVMGSNIIYWPSILVSINTVWESEEASVQELQETRTWH